MRGSWPWGGGYPEAGTGRKHRQSLAALLPGQPRVSVTPRAGSRGGGVSATAPTGAAPGTQATFLPHPAGSDGQIACSPVLPASDAATLKRGSRRVDSVPLHWKRVLGVPKARLPPTPTCWIGPAGDRVEPVQCNPFLLRAIPDTNSIASRGLFDHFSYGVPSPCPSPDRRRVGREWGHRSLGALGLTGYWP